MDYNSNFIEHNPFNYSVDYKTPMQAYNLSIGGKKISFKKSWGKVKDVANDFVDKVKEVGEKIGQTINPLKLAVKLLQGKKGEMKDYLASKGLSTSGDVIQLAIRIAKHRNLVKGYGYSLLDNNGECCYGYNSYDEYDINDTSFNMDPATISAIVMVVKSLIEKFGKKKVEDEQVTEEDYEKTQEVEVTTPKATYKVATDPLGRIVDFKVQTPTFSAQSKQNDYKDTIKWIAISVIAAIIISTIIYFVVKK